jgi:hypothetical protein
MFIFRLHFPYNGRKISPRTPCHVTVVNLASKQNQAFENLCSTFWFVYGAKQNKKALQFTIKIDVYN